MQLLNAILSQIVSVGVQMPLSALLLIWHTEKRKFFVLRLLLLLPVLALIFYFDFFRLPALQFLGYFHAGYLIYALFLSLWLFFVSKYPGCMQSFTFRAGISCKTCSSISELRCFRVCSAM